MRRLPAALLASLAGVAALLAWPDVPQPDWALAILGGLVLARPAAWGWAASALLVHDLAFWGAPWHLWWAAGGAVLLPWLDARIGPGVPQRAAWGLAALVPAAGAGWPMLFLLLTALAMTAAWRAWGEALGAA